MKNRQYLDIHTHILPGVDDGSGDWNMTRHMLEMEYAQGVTTIIATPHNYPGEKKQDNKRIRELCAKTQEIAQEISPSLQVLPGNEIWYRESIVREIEKNEILTLADSRYVLLEYQPGSSQREILNGIKELTENGYFPVIAHIERVLALLEDDTCRKRALEAGAYMQTNCQSLQGGFWNRQTRKLRRLIDKGEIHFLGSDCHNLEQRPPLMQDVVISLKKSISNEMTERIIHENTRRFLNKEYI